MGGVVLERKEGAIKGAEQRIGGGGARWHRKSVLPTFHQAV